MPRLSQSDRSKLWLDRLNRFAASGQTVAAFCAAERCSTPSFYQWKHKLKSARPTAFAELSVVAATPTLVSSTAAAACVHLPNGVRIELGTEQATVKTIITQVLESSISPASPQGASC